MTSTNTTNISAASVTTPSINVSSIVGQLITAEQQPITGLNTQITSYQSKISAIGTVQSALSSFQVAAQGVNSLSFKSFTANASNSSALSATASSIAQPGSYSLSVSQLAQAQSLVAVGQPSATTTIGSGIPTTLTFDFGTIAGGTLSNGAYSGAGFTSNGGGTRSVTIDSSNNTLSGIRDAINAANIGVSATIINDGSSSPNRLVLTSTTPGAANSMKISVSAGGDPAVGSLMAQDPTGTQNLSQTSIAQNANFTVNGVPISKNSNTVSDVIPGVTLNLSGTSASPFTLAIAPDTASVTASINSFVKAYNDVIKAIQTQTSYDPTTKVAGTLQGDVSLSIIQSQMAAMLTRNIGGNQGAFNNLAQIGIGFQQDGTIAVNATALGNALNSNYQGVANLFAAAGSTTDSLVKYTAATPKTQNGTYGVVITQMSTQGTATGSAAAGLTITSGVNDSISLAVDGVGTTVILPAGTYTAASMATQLQTLINGSTPISSAGKSASVSQNAGVLAITSGNYGSASRITITGGNGAGGLFGTPNQAAGLDVAGTINGMAASGTGQLLTSSVGNSQGLVLSITGGTAGSRGNVSYSQGLSSMFSSMATAMLGSTGALASETTQFNSNIKSVQSQIDALNAQIATDQTNLTNQYSQLDATLGSMNSLSSYLTQQLAQL